MSCLIYSYAECHYAECHYAECHYAECHYAECRYAECHYTDRRCTLPPRVKSKFVERVSTRSTNKSKNKLFLTDTQVFIQLGRSINSSICQFIIVSCLRPVL